MIFVQFLTLKKKMNSTIEFFLQVLYKAPPDLYILTKTESYKRPFVLVLR